MEKKAKISQDKILSSALQSLVDRLEKTEQFVLDQAPDLCKQMVKEVMIENYVLLAAAVLLALVSIPMIPISIHNHITYVIEKSWGMDENPTRYMFLFLAGIVGTCSAVGMALSAAYHITFLRNCPKLFLVREFKRLLR